MKIPIGKIPKHLEARSPKRLRALMLKTQARLGYGVQFFDFQYAREKWHTWYYDNEDITRFNVEESLNDDDSIRDNER